MLLNLHNKAHVTAIFHRRIPPAQKILSDVFAAFCSLSYFFILHPCASLLLLPPLLYHTLSLGVLLCIVYDLLIGPQACMQAKASGKGCRDKSCFSALGSLSPPLPPSPRRQKYVGKAAGGLEREHCRWKWLYLIRRLPCYSHTARVSEDATVFKWWKHNYAEAATTCRKVTNKWGGSLVVNKNNKWASSFV